MLLLLWILTKEPVRQIINLKDHQITHPNERQVGRSHAHLDPQDLHPFNVNLILPLHVVSEHCVTDLPMPLRIVVFGPSHCF